MSNVYQKTQENMQIYNVHTLVISNNYSSNKSPIFSSQVQCLDSLGFFSQSERRQLSVDFPNCFDEELLKLQVHDYSMTRKR